MMTETLPSPQAFLKKSLLPGVSVATLLLAAIMLLALGLHLYRIQSIGDANAYYTAAVESMLQSWHNFFFVAAEPGGSVTVDKPPLGLWIEAAFAWVLGVSGVSVTLPNILAGVFSVPLLYAMVRRHMGELAGLVAALVLTITPVFVATNRNNTMDGLLVFFLLAAAWAFLEAAETGRSRWLMLGAFIVGLGFNIKMMQAFLPLPAFYALYFFASKEGWLRKVLNLGVATVLLAAVSLSWAVLVDLTPADQRPYIGSSGDNTVMGLILGHNGTSRLFGGARDAGGDGAGDLPQADGPLPSGPAAGGGQGPQVGRAPQQAVAACADASPGAACSFDMQFGTVKGTCITPPNQDQLVCAPRGMNPQAGQALPVDGPVDGGPNGRGGSPFSNETGSPGALRFFTQPLSKQMSWLLPFALLAILPALFGPRLRLPLEAGAHKALLLWGGWLVTCVVFFSMISGIFHAYYAIMLAPALGAMVGIGSTRFMEWSARSSLGAAAFAAAVAVTLGFQVLASLGYGERNVWMVLAGVLFAAGLLLLTLRRRLALSILLAALMVIPAYWTVMTTISNADINLPTAYSGIAAQAVPDGAARQRQPEGPRASSTDQELLDYLQANTTDVKYLAAVSSAQGGAPLVLATGRPVLYMGGFNGGDDVVGVEDLSRMVAAGELRYILFGGERGGTQDLAAWLNASCSIVPEFGGAAGQAQGTQLYECR